MRAMTLILATAAFLGCATPADLSSEDSADEPYVDEVELGSTVQRLSFGTSGYFAMQEPEGSELAKVVLMGTNDDTRVEVRALTATPSGGSLPSILTTLEVPALSPVLYEVPKGTFPFGVGAIELRSVDEDGNTSSAPLTAHATLPDVATLAPVSGASSRGPRFRFAHFAPPAGQNQTVKLAITNLGVFHRVHIVNPWPLGFKKWVDLHNGQTYLFDSAALGVNVNRDGLIEVRSSNGSHLLVSATIQTSERTTRAILTPLQ